MTDWASLRHAYGSAEDLPELLAALASGRGPALDALYTRICHQGRVYSASFAALPVLAQIAARLGPPDRIPSLRLAAAILCSDDVAGSREAFLRPVADVVPRFQDLCRDGLFAAGLAAFHFVEYLRLARSFDGDRFWGERLGCLTVEQFGGACPHCRARLYLSIGEGASIGDESFVALWRGGGPDARRGPITPVAQLTDDAGRWLYEQSQRAGQADVASALRYLFGSARCPACGERFCLRDA
jgi:hypothetical protein